MGQNAIDNKRIVLIACASEIQKETVSQLVQKIVGSVQIFYALDGMDALHKIQNSPPHILIADVDLQKLNGLKLASNVIGETRFAQTCIILLGPTPDEVNHIEQVLSNRLQFTSVENTETLSACINKALNQMSQKSQSEFHLRFIKAGETLIKEGDKADFVYIVRRGTLAAQHNRNGQITLLGEVHPGEFVGEMAYINGEARSADVVALTDSELIEIPLGSVDNLLLVKPTWARALMQTLSKRLKAAIK